MRDLLRRCGVDDEEKIESVRTTGTVGLSSRMAMGSRLFLCRIGVANMI